MLSVNDSNALKSLASSSRTIENDVAVLKEQGWMQLDALNAIHAALGKGGGGGIGGFQELGKAGKAAKEGGTGLKAFAEGVSALGTALLKFVSVPKKQSFIGFFDKLVVSFSKAGQEGKNVERGIIVTKKMGKSLLVLGGALALSTILFLVGAPGALLASVTIAALGFVFGTIGKTAKSIRKGVDSVLMIGLAIASIALGLFTFQLLNIDIKTTLSAGLAIATIGLAFALIGIAGKQIKAGAESMLLVGASIASVALGLYIFEFLSLDKNAMLQAAIMVAVVGGAFALIGVFGAQIKKGAISMLLASASIVAVGLSFFIFKKLGIDITDSKTWEQLGAMGALIGLIGGAFAGIGLLASYISAGSISMLLASAAIVAVGLSFFIFKKLGIDITEGGTWEQLGSIGVLIGLIGGAFAGLGLLSVPIAAGAIALGLSSLAIMGMTLALWVFKKLKWGSKENDDLSDTISGVLGALSGTKRGAGLGANIKGVVGQGLQAILALITIGPLILGSAAIWIMSMALKKFKTVGWTRDDNFHLIGTIDGVIEALRGGKDIKGIPTTGKRSILDTIVALMSAGSVFVAAGAIWLLSDALLKFKKVKWGKDDTKELTFTIKEILSVMQGGEKKGGLWSKIKGVAKGVLGAGASAGNATSIGLAGLSIGSLADSLIKWKKSKWSKNDNIRLKAIIGGILDIFKGDKKSKTTISSELKKIIDLQDPFESIAESMEKIAEEAGNFSKNIDKIDGNKLEKMASVSKSSKVMDSPSKKVWKPYSPVSAPTSAEQKGEKSVTTKKTAKIKPKVTSEMNTEALEMQIEGLQEEVRKLNGGLGRIESTLLGTLKVENVD